MLLIKLLIVFTFAFSVRVYATCVDIYSDYFENVKAINKTSTTFPFARKRYSMIRKDGRTYLEGGIEDAELLLIIANELKDATKISHVPVVLTIDEMKHVDITKYLDKDINNILGRPTLYGPNCWNFACYITGAVKGVSYTSPEEFNFLINSPLAIKVNSIDELKMGDLIAIRSDHKESPRSEVHGITYLTPNLWLNKMDVHEDTVFEVADSIFVGKEYEKLNGKIMNAFRMKKLDEYLDENLNDISDVVMNFYSEFRLLEIRFNHLYLMRDENYEELRDIPQNLLNEYYHQFYAYTISKEAMKDGKSEAELFLVDYILLRMDSIFTIELNFRG